MVRGADFGNHCTKGSSINDVTVLGGGGQALWETGPLLCLIFALTHNPSVEKHCFMLHSFRNIVFGSSFCDLIYRIFNDNSIFRLFVFFTIRKELFLNWNPLR